MRPGQGPVRQNAGCGFDFLNQICQFVDIGCSHAGLSLFHLCLWRCSECGSQSKQCFLNGFGPRTNVRVRANAARKTENGVQFIDAPVGFHTLVPFGDAHISHEPCLPAISTFCCNAHSFTPLRSICHNCASCVTFGSFLAQRIDYLPCRLFRCKLTNHVHIQPHDRPVFLGELPGFFFPCPVEVCQQNAHKTGVCNHGDGTFRCCCEQEGTFCAHTLLKLLKRFPAGSRRIRVLLCPTLCQGRLARFDLAPGKTLPLAKLDFA